MDSNVLIRNNVRVFGEGEQAMIFAHGFGCDQNMWRFITPAFEKKYKIILFDYIGNGQSDIKSYNKERYSSLQGYAQDILDICKELNVTGAVLVAHSVSCMVGLLAAIAKPAYFSNFILVGPSPCYINKENYFGGFERSDIEGLLETMDKNYIGWVNFMAPAIMANSDRPELGQELTDSFCSTDPVIARQFAEVTFFSDNRRDLQNLHIPSLILQCAEDIIAPKEVGAYLHQQLPQSTINYMQATGHCPHLSAPDETIQLMKRYLEESAD